ncbi:MAG: hypothetical protein R2851_15475 [Caldilineaceae bacterium]
MRATAILGDIAEVVHPAADSFDLSGYASVVEAAINIITRHPMSQEQLMRALQRWSPGQIDAALRELAAGGRARWSPVTARRRTAAESHSLSGRGPESAHFAGRTGRAPRSARQAETFPQGAYC